MNIDNAITEVKVLTHNSIVNDAMPALMAAYATLYLRDNSVALKHLQSVDKVTVNKDELVAMSPTRVEVVLEKKEAPVLSICAEPAFLVTDGLSEKRILEAIKGHATAVDRIFQGCVKHLLNLDSDPTEKDYVRVKGTIAASDILWAPLPYRDKPRSGYFSHDDGQHFYFSMLMTVSLAVSIRSSNE